MQRIKDKKISVWKYETISNKGVTQKVYSLLLPNKIWAYYQETGGNKTISEMGIVLVNTVEDCIFQINNRKDIEANNLIQYNGKVYEIQHINNFEDYRTDIVISAKLGNSIKSYNGMYLF